MDTVTHAMTGLIFAAPFAVSHPLAAGCIAVGSVLPDLDALSRIGGKLAFLRWHQTVSHSVFGLAGYVLLGSALGWFLGEGVWSAGLGLAAGALLHIALDLTNTYGLAVLAPLSARRFCLEWVFFIDAVFIAVCVACLALLGHDLVRTGLMRATAIVLWFALVLSGYCVVRAALRYAAVRRMGLRPDAMVPSALWPWVWFGYVAGHASTQLTRVDLFRGVSRDTVQTFDEQYAEILSQSDAYRVMSGLSAGYRATKVESNGEETVIHCRDLRLRNFGGTFGNLEITLDASGSPVSEVLNV